mmetsp:Transcript_87715/g.272817  ORF Transcript_87715/g.272817 Transcript_87715/m.272817 type:complete len:256 (-) Transcript_87715:116-883(-)
MQCFLPMVSPTQLSTRSRISIWTSSGSHWICFMRLSRNSASVSMSMVALSACVKRLSHLVLSPLPPPQCLPCSLPLVSPGPSSSPMACFAISFVTFSANVPLCLPHTVLSPHPWYSCMPLFSLIVWLITFSWSMRSPCFPGSFSGSEACRASSRPPQGAALPSLLAAASALGGRPPSSSVWCLATPATELRVRSAWMAFDRTGTGLPKPCASSCCTRRPASTTARRVRRSCSATEASQTGSARSTSLCATSSSLT